MDDYPIIMNVQTPKNPLKYIRVEWFTDGLSEPKYLYYEIKEDGWATRGIEVLANGAMLNIGRGLYEAPIPPLDEINAIPEFAGVEISKEEFEIILEKLNEGKDRG